VCLCAKVGINKSVTLFLHMSGSDIFLPPVPVRERPRTPPPPFRPRTYCNCSKLVNTKTGHETALELVFGADLFLKMISVASPIFLNWFQRISAKPETPKIRRPRTKSYCTLMVSKHPGTERAVTSLPPPLPPGSEPSNNQSLP